jgi:hypothetical protein
MSTRMFKHEESTEVDELHSGSEKRIECVSEQSICSDPSVLLLLRYWMPLEQFCLLMFFLFVYDPECCPKANETTKQRTIEDGSPSSTI